MHRLEFAITISGIDGDKGKIRFKAATAKEQEMWVNILAMHINESQGFKLSLRAPNIRKIWRQHQISEAQFMEEADTFDILLFQTNNPFGDALRKKYKYDFGELTLNSDWLSSS